MLNLIGWAVLLIVAVASEEFTSAYGEGVGTAVLGACAVAAIALLWKTFSLLGLRGFATTLFEWAATLFAWGLLFVGFSRVDQVTGRFGEVAGNTLVAACLVMFGLLVWKTFSLMGDDDAGSERGSGESNNDGSEESSLLKKTVVAGVAAKTYQNVLRKPTVIPPPGWVIKGLKQKGFGSTWEVRYGTVERHSSTNTTRINKRTRGFSHGGAQFKVEWP